MNDMRGLLEETFRRAARFVESLPGRRVAASREATTPTGAGSTRP